MRRIHNHSNDGCPLNDPETGMSPVSAGIQCNCEPAKIDSVILLRDGQFAVLRGGNQVAALQEKSAIHLLCEFAESLGFDMDGASFASHSGVCGAIRWGDGVCFVDTASRGAP